MPIFTKLEGYLAAAVAAIVLIAVLWLYVHTLQAEVVAANRRADLNHATAVVTGGQVAAGQAASAVVDKGAARDQLTLNIHTDNAHAIAAAPGSNARLDPALNAVGRRGLCRFGVYAADPACAGLRGPDPAVLSSAGFGSAAPVR